MTTYALAAALLSLASPSPAQSTATVGVHSFVMTDPTRRDSISPAHVRQWRVDLYYPARERGRSAARGYAPDPGLLDRLVKNGYYDVPQSKLREWEKKPGPASADAPVANAGVSRPLVTIAPGSGVAAFSYSELAASLVKRGYIVAVIDLPYIGISRLPDGRFMDANADPIQQQDDPRSWRPRIREWSADTSRVLDHLLSSRRTDLPMGLKVDPARILVTGHSMGGTVALQVCHDDERVEGCGDFEGAPMASDTFDDGSKKPLFITAARSAKPDRPFKTPDLTEPFWAYLSRDPSGWAVAITRASHMSYSDAPFEMPDTLSRFGGELMSPERSFDVYTGLVDAFSRAYAPDGGGDRIFRRFLDATPEVLGQRTGGESKAGKTQSQ